MASLPKHDAVRALKTLIAAHHQAPAGNRALPGDGGLYPFGIPAIDEVLQGGIAANATHEVRCTHARDAGAATGFVLGLLSGVLSLKARRVPAGRIVWVLGPAAAMETGLPCPDGLCEYGVDPCRIILARPAHLKDALWAAGEAVRCGELAALVIQIRGNPSMLDQSVTRRLMLGARESGVFTCILRLSGEEEAAVVATRWRVEASPSLPDEEYETGLGGVRHVLTLEKSANGRTGQWPVAWNPLTRTFRHAAHEQPIPHSPSRLPALGRRPDRPAKMGQVVALGQAS